MRIGIDIGGTTVSIGIVDGKGCIHAKTRIDTLSSRGPDSVIERIIDATDGLIEKSGMNHSDFEHIGIGCAGMIDKDTGTVIFSNNIGWNDVPLGERMRKHFGLPVYVANDAVCATIGEFEFGAGRDFSSMLMITIGTGIGGGMIIDGKLYEGFSGTAGIIGHITIDRNGPLCSCGRHGCFELYASTDALVKRANKAADGNPDSLLAEYRKTEGLDGRNIFRAIRNNDETALALFESWTDDLSEGIADLVNVLNPESIVLSGGICREGKLLTDPVKRKVEKEVYCGKAALPEIAPAALLDDAGMVGASALPEFI